MSDYASGFIALALVIGYLVAHLSFKYDWKIKEWF